MMATLTVPVKVTAVAETLVIPPEQLAQMFHESYERLAPDFGYRTREASAKPWADVPDQNKQLMIAVSAEVLSELHPR